MQLETQRLILLPLTAAQLEQWVNDLPALEQALGCRYEGEPIDGFFGKIVAGQIAPCKAHPDQLLYHTFWLILLKESRVAVGAADFKAPPNEAGEVEMGYGLGKLHKKHGYMTETVAAMKAWALNQPGVGAVIAETEADNLPSQQVLRRCGFALHHQNETLWWRAEK